MLLIRHASAGKRKECGGENRRRRVDERGDRQALQTLTERELPLP